ncbi:MAG: ABC transporter substrate-binding protein [Flavipsychrobacter sp.]|nr:ABC transporter substrate-binding protein [Flavipsychrobacter sp.]
MYRHRLNKLLLTAFLAACWAGLPSCGSDDQGDKANVVYLNYSSGALESIDPAFAKNLYNMWTDHMVYNTLVETNEALQLVPSLARRWAVSADGLTYTFYLRDDVYFQDNAVFPGGKGRKMVAADVVYSFGRLVDPAIASSGAWIFNDRVARQEPFRAVNDTTVQIKLLAPFRPLPEILTMPYCSIVPREVAEHYGKDFSRHPCGTGPYQFHYWDEGNVLILHKNPHYWETDEQGERLPYTDAVQIGFADSKATEFFLFLQGKVDFVNGLDGSFKDLVLTKNGELKKEYLSKIRFEKKTYLNTEYIGFLTDTANALVKASPTRYRLVRQAINYAIDRKRISTYFKNGMGTPATSGFIPRGMPGYDSTGRYGYDYNPTKAMALLKEAGFPGGKGLEPFTILTPDNWADIVNFVATQLQDVGIPAKVEIIQPNILRQQMSRSQAIAFRGQWLADYPDGETYLAFFNSRFPAPPNYTRFAHATFDQWYDASMNAPDSLRHKLYQRMDSLVMSEAPLVPLFYDQRMHFTQLNVSGFSSNPMNLIDLKRVRKNNSQRPQ